MLMTGINLGQRWTNIEYIVAGQFTSSGGSGSNFLVTNTRPRSLKKEGSSLNAFQGDRYCRCQSDKSESAP
jgi:hypothetical protein